MTSPVDEALPAVRELLESSGTELRVVGGVAVIHHGYLRTTEDIDVLVEEGFAARMDSRLGPMTSCGRPAIAFAMGHRESRSTC